MNRSPIRLEIDFGRAVSDAMSTYRSNPKMTLADFIRRYPARAREQFNAELWHLPLQAFLLDARIFPPGRGVNLMPPEIETNSTAGLGLALDELFATHQQSEPAENEGIDDSIPTTEHAVSTTFRTDILDRDAVHTAYYEELEQIARLLKNDLSVLVICDKVLTEHIYEHVCHATGREPILDDQETPQNNNPQAGGMMSGGILGMDVAGRLRGIIEALRERQVLILRSLDIYNRDPRLTEILYTGASGTRKVQMLAFIDPTVEVDRVLMNRFPVHVQISGLRRYYDKPNENKVYMLSKLITRKESAILQNTSGQIDYEGLYKNVAGLSAIQFRNAMRYVAASVSTRAPIAQVYDLIRLFKKQTSEDIDIPDVHFNDIGGYDEVKRELRRLVSLISGDLKGIDEKERARLIPRGFIFHGPPGTGKTLFAKAIANEMHATIQMISGPEVMDKYVGQSESNLRQIFATARRNAPSVIFFDEFDSIASQRSSYTGGGGERANNAVVAQLLTELDGFRQDQAVLVIGTSNRLDIIDEALLRPSRLRPIEIPRADVVAREAVARIHAGKFGVDVVLKQLFELVAAHLSDWDTTEQSVPQAFLDTLFAQQPALRHQYEAEEKREAFVHEIAGLFELVQGMHDSAADVSECQSLTAITDEIQRIGAQFGLQLGEADDAQADIADLYRTLQPIHHDLRTLFHIVQQQSTETATFTADDFLNGIFKLVAEYTDEFNNDEIRAIFQEASLEYHLDGRLITPRFLGMKVGLIRSRRDEREKRHI